MGEGFFSIDIILFALIAGFLIYQLRSVLGRSNGESHKRINPFVSQSEPSAENARDKDVGGKVLIFDKEQRSKANTVTEGLNQIKLADSNFEEQRFLQGVNSAFGIIVEAYAHGDTGTLRPLLSDDVYDSFSSEIRRRVSVGETYENHIERIKNIDILEAKMDGRTAVITVKIVNEQSSVVRDANGTILDGDPDRLVEVSDIWTFSRNTRTRDPNWLLVEIRELN